MQYVSRRPKVLQVQLGIAAMGAGALALARSSAPVFVLLGLLLAAGSTLGAWKSAEGTALRATVVWAAVALGLGILAELAALREAPAGGRPLAGHLAYLTTLATLAALISVLNARSPGGGAWAVLMGLLVLVFLIPWLEGSGLARGGGLLRLRLGSPWTIFYGLLVLAGVTNYLPTRYGPAAALLGLGFVVEYVALTSAELSPGRRGVLWSAQPWSLAAAIAVADRSSRKPRDPMGRFDATWFWFRDHWGVVWALRVAERFNRTAEAQGWSWRLGWDGIAPVDERATAEGPPGEEVLATLTTLLRRFARASRVERAAETAVAPLAHGGRLGEDS